MLPSAAELEYFVEVAATLNLSRASERLGISQPSLSLAIKRLEQAIGAPLFLRHKQGVNLTQAGKQLLLSARQLLQLWENTKAQALASLNDVQGYFTLGCHPSIAMFMVAGFLPALVAKYPQLEIHLRHDISRRIAEQIINLSIDIGIVVNPFKHPDLIIRKLCDDEVTFFVGAGTTPMQDLYSGKAVILCHPDLMQTDALLKECKKQGISFARMMTTNSLEVVASMTANGCGVGILPTCVAKAVCAGQLERVPDAPQFIDEVCLVLRHENREVRAIKEIASAIKAYFQTGILHR